MRAIARPRNPRRAPISHEANLAVVPAVAALARFRTPAAVASYLADAIPERFYKPLRDHVAQRPAMFTPAIHEAALAYLDADEVTRAAMCVFARPPMSDAAQITA